MFTRRRGSSVYVVYDEDTFLAAPNRGCSPTLAAVSAAPARHTLPLRWTRPLLIAAVGATGIQLWGSWAAGDHRPRSQATARHGQPAVRAIHRQARGARRRPLGSGQRATAASTPPADRASHHRPARHARRAGKASRPRRTLTARTPAVAAESSAALGRTQRRPSASARPVAATRTAASDEFGFEG